MFEYMYILSSVVTLSTLALIILVFNLKLFAFVFDFYFVAKSAFVADKFVVA